MYDVVTNARPRHAIGVLHGLRDLDSVGKQSIGLPRFLMHLDVRDWFHPTSISRLLHALSGNSGEYWPFSTWKVDEDHGGQQSPHPNSRLVTLQSELTEMCCRGLALLGEQWFLLPPTQDTSPVSSWGK